MALHGVYGSPDGLPATRLSVVAFLDILGFTQAMSDAHKAGKGDEFLRRFSGIVETWYPLDARCRGRKGEHPSLLGAEGIHRQNSLIGHPIRDDGEPELGQVMTDVALLQLGLANEGLFVRGGIGVGPLYMKDDIVYGIGLLDAYHGELTADVPCIVLSDSAVALVRRHIRYYASVKLCRRTRHFSATKTTVSS